MEASHAGEPRWGWGSDRQLLACRLSHVFGLVAVLGGLVALGWSPVPDAAPDQVVHGMSLLPAVADAVRAIGGAIANGASVLPSLDGSPATHLSVLLPR